ncbi:MFS general substrate transporter [Hymenopellis radicata]|nr:MFS general substrate transporter [Hymenopellis radicata]
MAAAEDLHESTERTGLLTPTSETSVERRKRAPTPLPMVQIWVVLLLQIVEPITSQSIYPYINQLVSELDITGGDERRVGYYAGLIESLFFATEAMTVLHWSRLSDSIGRKPVLFIGLIGTTLSMFLFGLSRTFLRVMKSVMGDLTDSSNRAEGFALMPVVWSFGATMGPLIGGTFARPHDRFPSVFKNPFWEQYPYFLPCLISGACASACALLTLFVFKESAPQKVKARRSGSYDSIETQVSSKHAGPVSLRGLLIFRIIHALGERRVFINGMMVYPLIFALFPVISLCAGTRLVWVGIAVIITALAGAIFMFITASAPNKASLGATNGLSQTVVSITRAIGPAFATSLFSLSVEKNILGGYGVYALFFILSILALFLAVQLPMEMWEDSDENRHDDSLTN